MAERLDIEESALMEKLRHNATGRTKDRATVRSDVISIPDGRRMEQQIVAMMLHYPVMIPDILERNLLDHFEDRKLKTIAEMIVKQGNAVQGATANIVANIEDDAYRTLMAKLAIDEQSWDRQGCERLLTQFEDRHLRHEKNKLQRRIEAAEKDNDMDLLIKLLQEKQKQADKL